MTNGRLTKNDIEILIEALGAWEKAPMTDGAFSSLMTAVLAPNKEAREKMMANDEQERMISRRKGEQRNEAATRLKVKLFDMRDSLTDPAEVQA